VAKKNKIWLTERKFKIIMFFYITLDIFLLTLIFLTIIHALK